jgi:hypothetical protein
LLAFSKPTSILQQYSNFFSERALSSNENLKDRKKSQQQGHNHVGLPAELAFSQRGIALLVSVSLPWLSRCHLSLVRVLSTKEQYIRSGQLFLLCGTDGLFQLWMVGLHDSIHSSSFVFFPFRHIDKGFDTVGTDFS